MYDAGKIPEAMDAVRVEIGMRPGNDPELPELWVLAGWCDYRRKDYDSVRICLGHAGETRCALELAAYLAAYVDKNDDELRRIAKILGENVNVQNALIIRARDAGSTLAHDDVLAGLSHFASFRGVEAANLLHNGARFFLAKARDEKDQRDLWTAFAFTVLALSKYGSSGNWHHRAAVSFWQSNILDRLGYKKNAMDAAKLSLSFWDKAIELDPYNVGYQLNRQNVLKLIDQLRSQV